MANPNFLIDLGTALTAGLLGSIHCAGMCGPLVSLGCRANWVSSKSTTVRARLAPILFVSGKFVAYSLLGLLAGWLGKNIVKNLEFNHTIAVLSISTALIMVTVVALARLKPAWLGKPFGKVATTLSKSALSFGWKAPLVLGAAASLIPCGLLYAMVVRSSAMADPIQSMLVMQAFGLGTSPVLIGLGSLAAWIPKRWSKYGTVAGEAVLVLSAVALLWRGVIGLHADPVAACCGAPIP
jgi:sulfite exporter TauE/SafE